MRDVESHLGPIMRHDYQASTFGDLWPGQYDDFYSDVEDSMVDLLTSFADPPKALELAIGTGRITLPLSAKGVAVTGIDASSEMVAKLKAKAGERRLRLLWGICRCRRQLSSYLPGVQHDLRVIDPGASGGVFPKCFVASRSRRAICDRLLCSRPEAV